MTGPFSAKVQAGGIPCLDPGQATNLKKLGYFHADTEQTLAASQAIMNFTLGHESGNKASFFFLLGASGLGKTTILSRVLEETFPALEDWNPEQALYVRVLKSRGRSAYSLAVAILDALGDPFAAKRVGEDKLVRRALKVLKQRKYRLVVFDDCQNLLAAEARAAIEGAVGIFKEIVDDLKIPVVVSGHPETQQIIMAKDEIRGREVREFHLKPFNAGDRDSLMDLRAFLEALDADLPGQDIGLSNEGVARKICYLTGGRIGFIWRLIWNALERAQARGDTLRTRDIGYAFEELRTPDEEEMENVFL